MLETYLNIRRVIRRILEEIKATCVIAKETSWGEAFITLGAKVDIQVMNHNGFKENEKQIKTLMKKHEIMLKYYKKSFGRFMNEYDVEGTRKTNEYENIYTNCIWVCWWQGIDNAPDIVKVCIDSIKKNAGEHTVILLTEENYKKYVDMPTWVEEKKNKGIISRTHYSDILRLTLLARYGGVWLDSTFFCSQKIPNEYFRFPVWSIRRPGYGHVSVACGEFANYSLSCNEQYRWVYQIILDYVLFYWEKNDIMVDYLFLDYLIILVQNNYKNVADVFKIIEPNNPQCDELFKILGEPFDKKKWENMKRDTRLFKLTWKQSFPEKKNGQITFYGKLINGDLM
ncbi:capsular polysaccharide synthesis protein [Agathobacter sp. LCP21S3_B2]|uniref:capsular polysaccharide synthesis protein n=1 Tax=Agathobacter sp. LCP21S3_B2 TaxID=3438734 RepID=UPI003F91F02D